MTSAFKLVTFANITHNPVRTFLYDMRSLGDELSLDHGMLGLMSLYCGDKVADYHPETAAERTREIAAMLAEGDIHLAPLLSPSVFPPLDYLCHLWPVRAVERLALRLDDKAPKTPATAPLVIQYQENPFARRVPLTDVLPGIRGARGIVQMRLSGLLDFRPSTCLGRIIVKYLSNGELPDRSVCDGDVVFHVPAPEPEPEPTALWDELLQLAGNQATIVTLTLGTVVAVAILVLAVMKRRGANELVRLYGRKPIAGVKS
ncbi:hypothetical protein GY45DRAFT_91657 [Cubamyces sp. BRFM 1775]|nr:hypothetical protein GY45DRAFT_91657 [Cubamyces sp. BRFM 1775]